MNLYKVKLNRKYSSIEVYVVAGNEFGASQKANKIDSLAFVEIIENLASTSPGPSGPEKLIIEQIDKQLIF